MAALAADANIVSVGPIVTASFSANAADTYYKGSLVYIDAAGGCQLVPAATDKFLGVCPKQQVISAAAQEVEVMIWGHVWLPVGTNIAAEDEGDPLIMDLSAATTDNPGDCVSGEPEGDTALAADDIFIGRILRVTSSQMLIAIGATGMSTMIVAATPTNAWG